MLVAKDSIQDKDAVFPEHGKVPLHYLEILNERSELVQNRYEIIWSNYDSARVRLQAMV